MGRNTILWAALAVLAGTTSVEARQLSSLAEYTADQNLYNVARISSADGGAGWGLIVGRSGETIWIATAAHVVFSDEDKQAPFSGIVVYRRGDSREWTAGAPLAALKDLAFLPVRMPLAETYVDDWRQPVVDTTPPVGERLRIAAKPGELSYDLWRGEVVEGPDGGRIASLSGGQHGQSGAPISTDRGFVGLYLGEPSQILSLVDVRADALGSGVPWNLIDQPPRSTAVKLCLTVTGANPEQVRVNGAFGLKTADPAGCVMTGSGKNLLFTTDAWSGCNPAEVTLPSVSSFSLALECRPKVDGMWRWTNGFATIKRVGENLWSFEGFRTASRGNVTGHLKTTPGDPSHLMFSGQAQFGGPVAGTLTLESKRLGGDLYVAGTKLSLELTR